MNTKTDRDALWLADTLPLVSSRHIPEYVVKHAKSLDAPFTLHDGILAYCTEALWPAVGALSLRIRSSGPVECGDIRIEADPASPRHRTDLLLTRKGQKHAHYLFVCHEPVMTEAGKEAMSKLPKLGAQQIMEELLNPSPERRVIEADPENYRDPEPADFIEGIGGTRIPRVPAAGFLDYRPARETPAQWWPEMSLNLRPKIMFHLKKDAEYLSIGSGRTSSDAREELRILKDLSEMVTHAGLEPLVAQRHAQLEGLSWVQYGDLSASILVSAGLRLASDSRGMVTGDTIEAVDHIGRCVYAAMFERSLPDIRHIASEIAESNPGETLHFNDLRDGISVMASEGCTCLHVDNQSGQFIVELVEDGSVRILQDHGSRRLLETLHMEDRKLTPAAPATAGGMSMSDIWNVNGVLLSLESIACQITSNDYVPHETDGNPSLS